MIDGNGRPAGLAGHDHPGRRPLRKEQSPQPVVKMPDFGNPSQSSLPRRSLLGPSARSLPWCDMASTRLTLFICFLALGQSTLADAECLKSVSEVKANHVKTRWKETTENDGKPLTISIRDGSGGMVYSATKAGKLWLRGNVSVCRSGAGTEITLKNTKATSNVPMIARLALPSTQSARIVNNQITLAGGGWGGTFIGL